MGFFLGEVVGLAVAQVIEEDLVAIRFYYVGDEPGRRLETLPFYLYKIRGFLRRHIGDAVWLKGGIIEKPAYLIFRKSLVDEVKELLKEAVERGGEFKMEYIRDPMPIIMKYARDERVTVGFLRLPKLTLGSYESLVDERERELTEIVRRGFWLTDYEFVRAERAEISHIDPKWALLYNVAVKARNGREYTMPKLAVEVNWIRKRQAEGGSA